MIPKFLSDKQFLFIVMKVKFPGFALCEPLLFFLDKNSETLCKVLSCRRIRLRTNSLPSWKEIVTCLQFYIKKNFILIHLLKQCLLKGYLKITIDFNMKMLVNIHVKSVMAFRINTNNWLMCVLTVIGTHQLLLN